MKPLTLIMTLMLATSVTLGAQDFSVGGFNSIKGLGVAVEHQRHGGTDVFESYLDIFGLAGGRCKDPGWRLRYFHVMPLSYLSFEGVNATFYLGPGAGTGYVHDFEPGFFDFDAPSLSRNKGFCLSIAAKSGLLLGFESRRIMLDIGVSLEGGFHIRPDETRAVRVMTLYKNGIYRMFEPEISILYAF